MVVEPEDISEKSSRRRGRDPKSDKANDIAPQRKIASDSSDKAARRNAPPIKARANRSASHAAKVSVTAVDTCDESAQTAIVHHRTKKKTWGSDNAAEHRAFRSEERRILDETAAVPGLPKGRQRAMVWRHALDHKTPDGKN